MGDPIYGKHHFNMRNMGTWQISRGFWWQILENTKQCFFQAVAWQGKNHAHRWWNDMFDTFMNHGEDIYLAGKQLAEKSHIRITALYQAYARCSKAPPVISHLLRWFAQLNRFYRDMSCSFLFHVPYFRWFSDFRWVFLWVFPGFSH